MSWQATTGRGEIIGQDAVVEQFVRAAAHGRIGGSYLFLGPAGVGKSTVALAIAKSLLCEHPRPGLIACGACAFARIEYAKPLTYSHPVVHFE